MEARGKTYRHAIEGKWFPSSSTQASRDLNAAIVRHKAILVIPPQPPSSGTPTEQLVLLTKQRATILNSRTEDMHALLIISMPEPPARA